MNDWNNNQFKMQSKYQVKYTNFVYYLVNSVFGTWHAEAKKEIIKVWRELLNNPPKKNNKSDAEVISNLKIFLNYVFLIKNARNKCVHKEYELMICPVEWDNLNKNEKNAPVTLPEKGFLSLSHIEQSAKIFHYCYDDEIEENSINEWCGGKIPELIAINDKEWDEAKAILILKTISAQLKLLEFIDE